MKNLLQRKHAGFTLMELLIVMVILIILIAFLVPIVMNQWEQMRQRQAALDIKQFEQALGVYVAEHNDYPYGSPNVPRSGLAVLVGEPNQYQPNLQNPMGGGGGGNGFPMAPNNNNMPNMPTDATRGGGSPFGPNGMNPGMNEPNMPPSGDGFGSPNGPDMTRNVGSDNSTMQPGGFGNPDPMVAPNNMNMNMNMGGDPNNSMGPGNAPSTFNPGQGAGASQNYLGRALPKDPWGRDYYYEWPTGRRVDNSKPAIWSAGKDGKSDTDDDIISWKEELENLKKDPTAYQNWQQQQQNNMQPNPGGPNMPGMPQPGMPQPGMPQPGMPQPGMPQPGMPQPGM
ncbi:MAG: type II secretion system protein GspG, partial [Planctomycetaceae bacterium]|nr:type II secretion system protein GspG [Planctomycetaceae bacterium]